MIKYFHLYFALAHAWTAVAYLQPGPFPIAMSIGMIIISVAAPYKEAEK